MDTSGPETETVQHILEGLDELWKDDSLFSDLEQMETANTNSSANSATGSSISLASTEVLVWETLPDIINAGDAFSFASTAQVLSANRMKVLEVSRVLSGHVEAARKTSKSKVTGIQVEQAQAAFFTYMKTGASDLTILIGDNSLTMWLCTKALDLFTKSCSSSSAPRLSETASPVADEEADVAAYIGGFVCCKLKKRNSSTDDYIEIVDTIVSKLEPSHGTLLAAKSRGRLTNITEDGKCLFVALEETFRNLFPDSITMVELDKFVAQCVKNKVVQDCYHSATDQCFSSNNEKENVLVHFIKLYFYVRVHQKCKLILEYVRRKKRDTWKAKALWSKLAK